MMNSLITEYGTIEGTRHWDNDKIDNTGIDNAQSSMHATLTKLNAYIRSFCNCNTLLLASAMTFFPDVHVKAEWLGTLLGMNDDPTLSRHNHKSVNRHQNTCKPLVNPTHFQVTRLPFANSTNIKITFTSEIYKNKHINKLKEEI